MTSHGSGAAKSIKAASNNYWPFRCGCSAVVLLPVFDVSFCDVSPSVRINRNF